MMKLPSLLLCFTVACAGTDIVDTTVRPLAEITDAKLVLHLEPQKLVLDIESADCPSFETRTQAMLDDHIRANTFERGGQIIIEHEPDMTESHCEGAFAEWWSSALPATETSTITISDTDTTWSVTFSRAGGELRVLACTAPGGCTVATSSP
jgi:hypothetical protein